MLLLYCFNSRVCYKNSYAKDMGMHNDNLECWVILVREYLLYFYSECLLYLPTDSETVES